MPSIFHKVERSWRLIKASTAVLNSDGELLVLPVISGAISLALGGGMVALAMSDGTFEALRNGQSLEALNSFYIWLFAFYLVQYFVIIFFNTALVGAALERLDGGDPTIRSSLALATRRLPQILGYAIVSATVGVLLRMIAERFGLIGKLIGAGAAIAWAVTTFLVVPVIAAEGRGPLSAIERSTELLGKTWGENLIGNAGISLILGVIAAVVAFAGLGGATMLIEGGNENIGLPLFAAAFLVFVAVMVFSAALSAVYAASVYYYAVVGEPPAGFDRDLIRSAFAPSSR
ncbi:MAG: DUF6159 family protein [Bauldia sp.]